ncbi:hypothetical protein THASP1DRAFT_32519 [Thamnocephalis sphaerospora]|uniref:Uncharacterized protein n=1 Tax=Thamnocephalis sphaerospora TaxID=78915 RepID=A0A4P9XIT8_9FUNG|nr:hypothetical protein THASP1DRAFT_32519 [Thamnocephalis sphaerospora]|eukprot:RKP05643.1 hypothetical protein THASP1DRAFT_32519 [Thamnocephalis sphaerospora]
MPTQDLNLGADVQADHQSTTGSPHTNTGAPLLATDQQSLADDKHAMDADMLGTAETAASSVDLLDPKVPSKALLDMPNEVIDLDQASGASTTAPSGSLSVPSGGSLQRHYWLGNQLSILEEEQSKELSDDSMAIRHRNLSPAIPKPTHSQVEYNAPQHATAADEKSADGDHADTLQPPLAGLQSRAETSDENMLRYLAESEAASQIEHDSGIPAIQEKEEQVIANAADAPLEGTTPNAAVASPQSGQNQELSSQFGVFRDLTRNYGGNLSTESPMGVRVLSDETLDRGNAGVPRTQTGPILTRSGKSGDNIAVGNAFYASQPSLQWDASPFPYSSPIIGQSKDRHVAHGEATQQASRAAMQTFDAATAQPRGHALSAFLLSSASATADKVSVSKEPALVAEKRKTGDDTLVTSATRPPFDESISIHEESLNVDAVPPPPGGVSGRAASPSSEAAVGSLPTLARGLDAFMLPLEQTEDLSDVEEDVAVDAAASVVSDRAAKAIAVDEPESAHAPVKSTSEPAWTAAVDSEHVATSMCSAIVAQQEATAQAAAIMLPASVTPSPNVSPVLPSSSLPRPDAEAPSASKLTTSSSPQVAGLGIETSSGDAQRLNNLVAALAEMPLSQPTTLASLETYQRQPDTATMPVVHSNGHAGVDDDALFQRELSSLLQFAPPYAAMQPSDDENPAEAGKQGNRVSHEASGKRASAPEIKTRLTKLANRMNALQTRSPLPVLGRSLPATPRDYLLDRDLPRFAPSLRIGALQRRSTMDSHHQPQGLLSQEELLAMRQPLTERTQSAPMRTPPLQPALLPLSPGARSFESAAASTHFLAERQPPQTGVAQNARPFDVEEDVVGPVLRSQRPLRVAIQPTTPPGSPRSPRVDRRLSPRHIAGSPPIQHAQTGSRLLPTLLSARAPRVEWTTLTTLDISGTARLGNLRGLDVLCPALQELRARRCHLNSVAGIPEGLKHLDISGNALGDMLFADLRHLAQLEYLDVSDTQLRSLSGNAHVGCKGFRHLKELRADRNMIEALQGLEGTSLVRLSVRSGRLAELDCSHLPCAYIEELTLSKNVISRINNLGQLQQLQVLNLEYNEIPSISSEAPIPTLRTLRLSHNRLHTLHCRWFPAAHVLYIDCNLLRRIDGFDELQQLDSLSLREQQRNWEMSFDAFPPVRNLYLSGNPFPDLNRCARVRPELEFLELSGCGVVALPHAALWPNVRVLNLNYNHLRDLSPLHRLPELRRLLLVANGVDTVDVVARAVRRLPKLHALDLRRNPVSTAFYAPLVSTTATVLCLSLAPYQPDQAWQQADQQYRAKLSDLALCQRAAYRAAVVRRGPPSLCELDGQPVANSERAEAEEMLRWIRDQAALPDMSVSMLSVPESTIRGSATTRGATRARLPADGSSDALHGLMTSSAFAATPVTPMNAKRQHAQRAFGLADFALGGPPEWSPNLTPMMEEASADISHRIPPSTQPVSARPAGTNTLAPTTPSTDIFTSTPLRAQPWAANGGVGNARRLLPLKKDRPL